MSCSLKILLFNLVHVPKCSVGSFFLHGARQKVLAMHLSTGVSQYVAITSLELEDEFGAIFNNFFL